MTENYTGQETLFKVVSREVGNVAFWGTQVAIDLGFTYCASSVGRLADIASHIGINAALIPVLNNTVVGYGLLLAGSAYTMYNSCKLAPHGAKLLSTLYKTAKAPAP